MTHEQKDWSNTYWASKEVLHSLLIDRTYGGSEYETIHKTEKKETTSKSLRLVCRSSTYSEVKGLEAKYPLAGLY